MLTAIQFNDEFFLRRTEIYAVIANRMSLAQPATAQRPRSVAEWEGRCDYGSAHRPYDARVSVPRVLLLLGTYCDEAVLHGQRSSVWCVYAFDPLPRRRAAVPQLKYTIGGGAISIWEVIINTVHSPSPIRARRMGEGREGGQSLAVLDLPRFVYFFLVLF